MKWALAFIMTCITSTCSADSLLKGIDKPFDATTFSDLKGITEKLLQGGITVRNGPDDPVGPIITENPKFDICSDGKPMPGETCIVASPLEQARDRLSQAVDPRVIGGEPASIEEYPWQVILIDGDTPADIRAPFCGGSIVGYEWILTAAHCLAGITNPKAVDIVAGSSWPKFARQGNRVEVAEIHVHQGYNPTTFEHDIALLKLKTPVKKGKRISVASAGLVLQSGTVATVTGWGAVTAYGPMVDRLMRAKLPIVENSVCSQTASYGAAIKPGMMCAGEREGGLDACQGDSGGPLVANISGKATQIGVVSWGKGCAQRLKYGVYTRVSSYAAWISTTIAPQALAKKP